VEHDLVGRLDPLSIDGDVVQAPLGPPLEPRLAEQPAGFLLVRRRELEVHRPGGAPLQQLYLDLADAAADFKHGRALDPALLEELDHPPGDRMEATLAVPPRHPARQPGAEELIAAAWVAAARHRKSVPRTCARPRPQVAVPTISDTPRSALLDL
jgi:hypothetical protein